jgi:O-antigen/teichoic acid export membrane protein
VKWYKELQFYRDASYRFMLVCADALCTVILAVVIPSAVALIGGILLAAAAEVLLSFGLFSPRPRFSYISSRAKEIFENSRGLNLSAILNYVVENVDNLLIGKFVGATQLGIYANGYSLGHKPNLELGKSVQRGTLPIYVRLADDVARLRHGFWKSTMLSLGLFTLCSLPLILLPNWIVSTFLGSQWTGVEVILPLLTLAGLIQSFTVLSSTLFTATKQYFWLNANLFVNAVTLIPLLFITQKYGLVGGVWAVLLSRLVTLPVTGWGIWQTLYQPQRV